jgi:hypothetical protein
MPVPSANENWLIDAGDVIIQKKVKVGALALTPPERLLYCLWVADYSMRNAGDLDSAADLYRDFQTEAVRLAQELRLPFVHDTFSLPKAIFEREYLARFERLCDEIRTA